MNPNVAAMTRQELRTYVLNHRHDEEAFRAYVDRSDAEARWVEMSPVESIADLQQIPEFLQRLTRHTLAVSDDRAPWGDADLSTATSGSGVVGAKHWTSNLHVTTQSCRPHALPLRVGRSML